MGAAEEGSSVTASYWDTQTSTAALTSAGGVGKTTAELQSPTGYTGIYAGWNVDLNLDGSGGTTVELRHVVGLPDAE